MEEQAKYYKVKQYQTYIEFYEDSNVPKRSFTEGEEFTATDSQLNRKQLDRIEEFEPAEIKEEIKANVPEAKQEIAGTQANEDGAEGARRKAAADKLRGKSQQQEQTEAEANLF